MTGEIYSKRESVLEKAERTWCVGEEALEITDALGNTQRLSYARIARLRLAFAPTEWKSWRYICVVRSKGGAQFEIDNGHYKGIGDFEDRSVAYRRMIEALIEKLKTYSPQVEIHTGSGGAAYWGQILMLIVVFAILAYVLFTVAGPNTSGIVWVKGAIVVASLPVLALWIKRARPRGVKDFNIPEDALPKV